MFGKLRWRRCGSSREQREAYKAQLCTSCHAMREFSGRPTSLLANYDQSLLVMVLSAIAGSEMVERRCTAVPWRTVDVQTLPKELRTFVAAGNLALIDAKLRDDIDDGGRWWTRVVRFLLRRKTRRALRALRDDGFATELVSGLPTRQQSVERSADATLTQLAEPSANVLAAIFVHGGRLAGREDLREPLHRFGFALAQAVYVLDALGDHDEDRTKQQFNAVASTGERIGHETAVLAAQRFVDYAVVEAQQAMAGLLPDDRRAIVASILQQLTAQAERHVAHLLGRPTMAALRPAEAGDCDCSGCEACDCCSSGGDGCDGCGSCCEGCAYCDCFGGSKRKQKKQQRIDEMREQASDLPVR